MLKSLLLIFSTVFIFVSCSKGLMNGTVENNMEELDKTYGKCNNPFRQLSKGQKKICEDKQRAAGPDGVIDEPLNISQMINDFRSGGKTIYAGSSVNEALWNASLILVEPYNIKIADSEGGLISTEWIKEKNLPNKRCVIKINISSKELVSNGVKVKLLCEQKEMDEWYSDNKTYQSEEKNMTLKILEIAQEINTTEKLSS